MEKRDEEEEVVWGWLGACLFVVKGPQEVIKVKGGRARAAEKLLETKGERWGRVVVKDRDEAAGDWNYWVVPNGLVPGWL